MIRRCLKCMKEFKVISGHESENQVCPHCGFVEHTVPDVKNHLYPGFLLNNGRYEIGVVIGVGGFGVVYKAWDHKLSCIVAIKEYFPTQKAGRGAGKSRVNEYVSYEEYRRGVDRFLEEARYLCEFRGSKYIVGGRDFFEDNNTAYLVMEYLEGVNIKRYIRDNNHFSIEDVIEIADQVICGLREMHKKGIIHQDIKPDNVFLTGSDGIIIDFGATKLPAVAKPDDEIVLTPGYAPPEQYARHGSIGTWTDVYALSALLYFMLTEVDPEESTQREENDTLADVSQLNPKVPPQLNNAIMRGLALRRDIRLKTVDEMYEALHSGMIRSVKEEEKRKRIIRAIQMGAVAMVLLAGLGMAIYYAVTKGVLHDATITVWVSYDSELTEEEAKHNFEAAAGLFRINHDNIDIVLECFPEDEYEEHFREAAEKGTLPTMYMTDSLDRSALSFAENLDAVYDRLTLGDFYYLKEYANDGGIGMRSIPTGIDLPVAYVRTEKGQEAGDIKVENAAQLGDSSSKGFYISEDNYSMILNSLGGEYLYDDKPVITGVDLDLISSLSKCNYSTSEDAAIDAFVKGDYTYYLGSVRDYDRFDKLSGQYEIRPISTEKIYGEYCGCWAINKNSGKHEKKAAEKLLEMMLNDESQRNMHITKRIAVPILKSAFRNYVRFNPSLEIIEQEIDNAAFLFRDRAAEDRMTDEMQEKVIRKKQESIENWLEGK